MNDDVARAQNDLDAKLAAMGYEHPEKPQAPSNHHYKTINVKDEKGQYEASNKSANPYRHFSEQEDDYSKRYSTDICPLCNTKALFRCECKEYKDMMCKNNHVWWMDEKGHIHQGDPHEEE